MKRFILKCLVSAAIAFGLMVLITNADTIGSLSPFQIHNNVIAPIVTSSSFRIPSLGSTGNPCTTVNASGTFATSTCGSGGGGTVGPSTSTYVAVFNASGTITGYAELTFDGTKLIIGGASTSTITGDGSDSIIGGNLNIKNNGSLQFVDNTGFAGFFFQGDYAGNRFVWSIPTNTSTVAIVGPGTGEADLSLSGLTTAQTFTFPNQSGTIALGGGNGANGDCAKWSGTSTLTDAGAPCVTGGGGSSTLLYASSGIQLIASGTDYIIKNIGVVSLLSSSTAGYIDFSAPTGTNITAKLHVLTISQFTNDSNYIATNTGPWVGTWQGVNSSTFYLATNPNHYVATSSLGTAALSASTDFLASSATYLATFAINATTSDYSAATVNRAVTFNYLASSTWAKVANNLSDVTSSTARTNLGFKATSSLPIADANGIQSSYGGSSCTGGVQTGVSATGTALCAATSTLGLQTAGSYNVTTNNGSDFASSTATRINLAVNSSSADLWLSATTTKSQGGLVSFTSVYATRMVSAQCYDVFGSSETSSVIIYYNTTYASTSVGTVLVPFLTCGVLGNSTTTFSTAAVPVGATIYAAVSSTVSGASTPLNVHLEAART